MKEILGKKKAELNKNAVLDFNTINFDFVMYIYFVPVLPSLTRVLSSETDDVLLSFIDLDLIQNFWVGKLCLETIPHKNCNMFSGAHNILKIWHIFVKVFVIHSIHNCIVHVNFEIIDVHDHSCGFVNRSTQGDLDNIVMSMTMEIIAFSIQIFVLLVSQLRAVQTMARTEDLFSRQVSDG